MIPFTPLVVIPKDATTVDDVRETVFEGVGSGTDRLRDLPDYHLHESIDSQNDPAVEQGDGFHVGQYTNIVCVLSIYPTPASAAG
jgi:hypothetical protein